MTDAGDPAGERETAGEPLDRVATIPNAISAARILLIPAYVALILHHGTELGGLLLLGFTVATDWVDGTVARRTGQVSNLGKVLDPLADRLAIAAGLIALLVRGAFPLWAGLLVLVRDGVVLLASAALLLIGGVRIDVRRIGKLGTFGLMTGIPWVSWANFGLIFAPAFRVAGWICFTAGIVLYYAAAVLYVGDARGALAARRRSPA